jgi:hypothetical protein
MRRIVGLLVVVVFVFGIHSCLKDPTPSSDVSNASRAPSAASSVPVSVLKVNDLDGNPIEIPLTSDTSVLYMATWCPHSAAFKKMLNDPVIRSAMKGRKVVAVFGRGEWKTVRSDLKDAVKQGEFTQEQYRVALQNISLKEKKSIFFDPAFFDDLTIPAYIGPIPAKADGYPSAQVLDSFYSGSRWLRSALNVPVEDVNQLYARYDNASANTPSASNSETSSQ